MAVKRTPEERKEIARRCVEIEKEGGDVLGYLRSENYISPRATWINLQREVLQRPQSKLTSGKPQKKGEKKMDGKTIDARLKRLENLKEQINDGVNIRAALSSMGYTGKSAGQAYRQMKNLAKEHDPEFYAWMPEKISDVDAPVAPEMPTVKVDGGIRIVTPEAEKVEIVETPETYAKVTPEGIYAGKVPKPVEFAGLEVTAVKDPVLGEFYHDQKFGCVDWRTPEGDEVSMPVAAWRKLIDRLPEVLGVLGVKV